MGVAHVDTWHLKLVSIFIIIDKLIIFQPSNKMWIKFWHVSIYEGELCGDKWQVKNNPIDYLFIN
jgi:hypothetical protein